MQPMPAALKQLLAKGDVRTISSLFTQEHQRRRHQGTGPTARKVSYRAPQAFAAYIITTETRVEPTKARKKYTAYKILVSNGPTQTWVVRRYTEFHELHLQITKRFPHKAFPAFPRKRLLGNNFSSEFVLARREHLNRYLNAITSDPEVRSWEVVREFFSDRPPSSDTSAARNPTPPSSTATASKNTTASVPKSATHRLSVLGLLKTARSKYGSVTARRTYRTFSSGSQTASVSSATTGSQPQRTTPTVDPSRPYSAQAANSESAQSLDHTVGSASPTLKRRTLTLHGARRRLGLIKRRDLPKRRRVHLPPSHGSPGTTSTAAAAASPTTRSYAMELDRRYSSSSDDVYDLEQLTTDTANPNFPPSKVSLDDFCLLKVIGKGSYGKVMLARHKHSAKVYAIKVISKRQLRGRPDEIARVMSERTVLERSINHPFLVGLQYAFQTEEKLYFCIDYVNGGELFFHLQRDQRFNETRARFYVAEITLALAYLHDRGIVYRDLKPENCLLDSQGHIRLVDFGLAKDMSQSGDAKTSTFCGTPQYLAPEVLLQQSYGKVVDWYCLGAVLYEMLVGLPPYYSPDNNVMFNRILHSSLPFPSFVSSVARDFIRKLLTRNPEQRLGSATALQNHSSSSSSNGGDYLAGSAAVKAHPFFRGLDWDKLYRKEILPPYNPDVAGIFDLKNIDPEFSAEPIPQSLIDEGTISLALVTAEGQLTSAPVAQLPFPSGHQTPLSPPMSTDATVSPTTRSPSGFKATLEYSPRASSRDGDIPGSMRATEFGGSTKRPTSNVAHISRASLGLSTRNPAHDLDAEFDLEKALEDTDRAFRGFSFVAPHVNCSDFDSDG
ncbi:Serine/threonine-protein kinase Sgk2 [Dimargaris verticillata]|uniref:Serine/threonine-protein kinase Sgk2 n=1 Tax=Dimargaris verticillata TaxID=2761393 RepID=A0A9W8E9J2_9FUNG|nr:Serine/threonine-protein kinase Sgk2 [Dimargaris verticillata]